MLFTVWGTGFLLHEGRVRGVVVCREPCGLARWVQSGHGSLPGVNLGGEQLTSGRGCRSGAERVALPLADSYRNAYF